MQKELYRYKSTRHDTEEEVAKHRTIMRELEQNEVNYNPYIDYDFVYRHIRRFVLKVRELELFFDIKPVV
jgi:hypothetical protein